MNAGFSINMILLFIKKSEISSNKLRARNIQTVRSRNVLISKVQMIFDIIFANYPV